MRCVRRVIRALMAAGVVVAASASFVDCAWGFDGIRITLLGTGHVGAGDVRAGPSTLIEAGDEVLLFDCGASTVQRLQEAGLAVGDLTAVFLSNLDERHIAGCRDLWRIRFQGNGGGQLPVWGPRGTKELFSGIEHGLRQDDASGALAFDIADNVVYQPEGVSVVAFVGGGPGSTETFGYRVDANRRAVALSGDARYSENIARYAGGVQVLLHEVAAASAQRAPADGDAAAPFGDRSGPEDAGQVFRAARPYLAVYSYIMLLGVSEEELLSRTRRIYRGALEVGRDLMVIELQNEVQIRDGPSEPRHPGAPR